MTTIVIAGTNPFKIQSRQAVEKWAKTVGKYTFHFSNNLGAYHEEEIIPTKQPKMNLNDNDC